ncbi:MAG: outer membrane lipoprotein carrier protein LolA [Novosphingobium sp.]|nr:outer membrane lipoprotein carrier protein LolA [Novosphingobium sp.]MCP5401446.1 outer membrane lipoprotein carrier protein LolA [Novosphingobium sp.]
MNRISKTFRNLAGAAALAALGATVPLALPASAAQAKPSDLAEAVAALRAISTMRADFTQTDRSGQTVGGVLTLKRPGRIRFQYEDSVPMLIVGNGKSLTMIDYEVNQVQRWPIRNSPLGALLDPNRDVARYGTLKPTGNPDVVSVEVRDTEHPEYGLITLVFVRKPSAPGGLELVSWVALDSQNKRTTIRLANQRYGIPVSDNTFRYNDPRQRVRR